MRIRYRSPQDFVCRSEIAQIMAVGGLRPIEAFLLVEFASCVVQRRPRLRQIRDQGAGRNEVRNKAPRREALSTSKPIMLSSASNQH